MPEYRFQCPDCDSEICVIRPMEQCGDPVLCTCGTRAKRIFTRVSYISDIDWQDGNTMDNTHMPGFGKAIRSRRDLREEQKRARDRHWARTEGNHEVWVKDPETGKMEKDVVEHQGVDLGEIRTAEPGEKVYKSDFKRDIKREIDTAIKEIRKEGKVNVG